MRHTILPIALFILMGFSASHAQPSVKPHTLLLAQNSQSLNQAASSIKRKTGGRVLSTKTKNRNGRLVYKIKVLLPSGKVQVFTVNAK